MARSTPPKGHPQRLLPVVAAALAELGYRRAPTAELARRCGVRENVLYRVWPTKKAMFVASIDYVLESSLEVWRRLLTRPGKAPAAQRLLEYEAVHHGEFGLYRIVFAGLSETEDPAIHKALRSMYRRFHRFVVEQVQGDSTVADEQAELAGWALVGVATVSNISRELKLMGEPLRQAMFRKVGAALLQKRQP